MKSIAFVMAALLLTQCKVIKDVKMPTDFDTQGHRGARGLLPENTIPAFKLALELGVNTLELDVVTTKDDHVLVSHEPWMNHEIASDLEGNRIDKSKEKEYNIFKMTLEEVKKYDVGLQDHPRFPVQKKIAIAKPSLKETVKACDAYAQELNRELPWYNIEIKRREGMDGEFHPDYKKFVDLVIQDIIELNIKDRSSVQCFDLNVLRYLNEQYPDHKQVFLVQNMKSITKNIQELGYLPDIYSPYFKLINEGTVNFCKQNGIKLICWTVNEEKHMKMLLSLGVDGIISDYPDRLMNLK